jgi:hypothetical protein
MESPPRELVPFIGGPYDGQALPVPHPISSEMELRVLPRSPSGDSAFYTLGEDGRFHYLPLPPSDPWWAEAWLEAGAGAEAYA